MAPQRINSVFFSPDIQEFIRLLSINEVKYLIVGGEAVIYYGHTRLTGDIDFFYERSEKNCAELYKALSEFWNGVIPGIQTPQELLEKGAIFQFGRPPNRIDLINEIDGVAFGEAWLEKEVVEFQFGDQVYEVYYLGLNQLIRNKESVKRPRDLEDLRFLLSVRKRRKNK
jgi:hypothetical protein